MDSADTPAEPQAAVASPRCAASAGPPARKKKRISPFWAKQLHMWHWMSSAICLIGMLLFAITGITLNHAADIAGDIETETVETSLPATLLPEVASREGGQGARVPAALSDWLSEELGVSMADRRPEWSEEELYVPLPRPGGDAWVAIDRASGDVFYEDTDRGWISYFNDLHKGRDTGAAWTWFIDIFAAACVIFSLTGFFLLQLHARHRPSTWPIVGAGLVLPLFLLLFFVHS